MQITIHTLNIHLTPHETALGAALVKAALAESDMEQPKAEHDAATAVIAAIAAIKECVEQSGQPSGDGHV